MGGFSFARCGREFIARRGMGYGWSCRSRVEAGELLRIDRCGIGGLIFCDLRSTVGGPLVEVCRSHIIGEYQEMPATLVPASCFR